LSELNVHEKAYALLTVHRAENSDNPQRIGNILQAMEDLDIPVVFPIHPRTEGNLKRHNNSLSRNIAAAKPLGYFDTLRLVRDAFVVFTDSGGIQQEACILGTPCITLRDRTEWVETVETEVNFLAGAKRDFILESFVRIKKEYPSIEEKLETAKELFGAIGATDRILKVIRATLPVTREVILT